MVILVVFFLILQNRHKAIKSQVVVLRTYKLHGSGFVNFDGDCGNLSRICRNGTRQKPSTSLQKSQAKIFVGLHSAHAAEQL